MLEELLGLRRTGQRLNDPIGYRVYEHLHSAVTKSIAADELHNRDGKEKKVANATVLGFRRRSRRDDVSTDFDGHVHVWLDELLPELMTARGSRVVPLVRKLRKLVLGLKSAGVKAFRFKDLVDPLKKETRRRWLGVWSETNGTEVPPHRAADLYGLNRCVSGRIDLEEKKKTREDLARTWTFLRATNQNRNGHMPSNVKLGKELGVDRSRVPTLLETLKRLVAECLSGQDQPTAPSSLSDESGGERHV